MAAPTMAEVESFLRELLASEHAPAGAREEMLADCYGAARRLQERIRPAHKPFDPGMSVADLGLSVRACRTLMSNGTLTLGELLKCDAFDLFMIPGLGQKSCKDIEAAVEPYGGLANQAVRAAERAAERAKYLAQPGRSNR